MLKLNRLSAVSLLGATVLTSLPAMAANDVRGQLTPELIYDHCQTAGVGSETAGTFMLPGGKRVVGTVLCTAEDLVRPKSATRGRHNDKDDDDPYQHHHDHSDEEDDD